MIQITEKAKEKVQEILTQENKLQEGLRVQAMDGGCCGPKFGLSFAEQTTPDDRIIDCGTFKVYVDPESLPHLEGATVDYVDGLNGTGFRIEGPEAEKKSSCGCSH
jgi:iron-sulfur cluster assembly accessory protein